LAEVPTLPELCHRNNIIFIGPLEHHVSMFGDKLASKDAAMKAKVPVVPGSPGPVAGVDAVKEWGQKIGYPIVIKNAAGGGGMY
jgi:pyruvate carboxylase